MSLRITPLNSAALTLCFYRHTLAEEHDFSARENYKMVLKSQLGASVLTVTIWRGREGIKESGNRDRQSEGESTVRATRGN